LQRPTVAATSTPTDETTRFTDKPASIETGGAAVVRHVQPGTGKAHTAIATVSAKRKRGAARSRTHAQAAHDDRYQVSAGGRRVGADPDLDIRMTLAKQYSWVN
jgi:hypothetical protein